MGEKDNLLKKIGFQMAISSKKFTKTNDWGKLLNKLLYDLEVDELKKMPK